MATTVDRTGTTRVYRASDSAPTLPTRDTREYPGTVRDPIWTTIGTLFLIVFLVLCVCLVGTVLSWLAAMIRGAKPRQPKVWQPEHPHKPPPVVGATRTDVVERCTCGYVPAPGTTVCPVCHRELGAPPVAGAVPLAAEPLPGGRCEKCGLFFTRAGTRFCPLCGTPAGAEG